MRDVLAKQQLVVGAVKDVPDRAVMAGSSAGPISAIWSTGARQVVFVTVAQATRLLALGVISFEAWDEWDVQELVPRASVIVIAQFGAERADSAFLVRVNKAAAQVDTTVIYSE